MYPFEGKRLKNEKLGVVKSKSYYFVEYFFGKHPFWPLFCENVGSYFPLGLKKSFVLTKNVILLEYSPHPHRASQCPESSREDCLTSETQRGLTINNQKHVARPIKKKTKQGTLLFHPRLAKNMDNQLAPLTPRQADFLQAVKSLGPCATYENVSRSFNATVSHCRIRHWELIGKGYLTKARTYFSIEFADNSVSSVKHLLGEPYLQLAKELSNCPKNSQELSIALFGNYNDPVRQNNLVKYYFWRLRYTLHKAKAGKAKSRLVLQLADLG